ncbi:MAG: 4Fe-4S dicluster domain-containing protein [Sulfurovaceae bacterium]
MRLELDVAKCVRAKSKFSLCACCAEASPEHISIVENIPTFKNQTGIEAAAAVGACPCEALGLSGIVLSRFFFDFLDAKSDTLVPSKELPCLSLLSVEHLLSLALALEQNLKINIESYDKDSVQLQQILKRVDEVNQILSAVSAKKIEVIQEGALKQKKRFEESLEADELSQHLLESDDIAKLKEQHIPEKRKILFSVLKYSDLFKNSVAIKSEKISFISDKVVNDSCTNCQMCYRLCPSGALSSDGRFSLINFDAMLCLKCRLCHDVCEVDAITMSPHFDLGEFGKHHQETLIHFDIKRCDECGNSFTYRGGEMLCPRCKVEEEEAASLHEKSGIIF